MFSSRLLSLGVACLLLCTGSQVLAHCQVPCGIYDDAARFTLLREHVTTIEKSMRQIEQLSGEAGPNWNQIVRWVDNKEHHADELAHIVAYYFMSQRVKPVDPADADARARYVEQLTMLHGMLVSAMKSKQTTDLSHVERLRELIDRFEKAYFGG